MDFHDFRVAAVEKLLRRIQSLCLDYEERMLKHDITDKTIIIYPLNCYKNLNIKLISIIFKLSIRTKFKTIYNK